MNRHASLIAAMLLMWIGQASAVAAVPDMRPVSGWAPSAETTAVQTAGSIVPPDGIGPAFHATGWLQQTVSPRMCLSIPVNASSREGSVVDIASPERLNW